jgi:hypothetical protein
MHARALDVCARVSSARQCVCKHNDTRVSCGNVHTHMHAYTIHIPTHTIPPSSRHTPQCTRAYMCMHVHASASTHQHTNTRTNPNAPPPQHEKKQTYAKSHTHKHTNQSGTRQDLRQEQKRPKTRAKETHKHTQTSLVLDAFVADELLEGVLYGWTVRLCEVSLCTRVCVWCVCVCVCVLALSPKREHNLMLEHGHRYLCPYRHLIHT